MIQLRFATLEWTSEGAVSRFPDGTSWGAFPHDEPHYHAVAHRLGYGADTLAYCREHELAHHLVSEAFSRPSVVVYSLAHGLEPPPLLTAGEEALAMTLQRYARCNEVPMIENVGDVTLFVGSISTAPTTANSASKSDPASST